MPASPLSGHQDILRQLYQADYRRQWRHEQPLDEEDRAFRVKLKELQFYGFLTVDTQAGGEIVCTLRQRGIEYVEKGLVAAELVNLHRQIRCGLIEAHRRAQAGDAAAQDAWEAEARAKGYPPGLLSRMTEIYIHAPG